MNELTYLLPMLIAIPAFGAIMAAVIPRAEIAKLWALTIAAITAVVAVGVGFRLTGTPYNAPPSATSWLTLSSLHFSLSLGIDYISLFLILLTVLLVPLAICASFDSISDRPRQYYAWMLALMTCMIGVFLARDILLFYAFFELTLVPSLFLIGIWGGQERRYAASKFFLYTFAGSVFTLAAIVYLGAKAGSFDLATVVSFAQHHLDARHQFWIALGLFAAFMVKSAMFPLHTWLPITYTEAPTPGTVILAGVMPKLGTYGILRLVIPIGLVARPEDSCLRTLIAVVGILSIIGILYGAMIAWVQRDMKRLLAYSSFSHLGFCVLGLMAMNEIGLQGSVLYMVNHGISTGALFLCVGMIFDRYRSTDQYDFSGLAKVMPKLAFFIVLFAMSSIGLPGLNGFASEFLTILGAFTSNRLIDPTRADAHLGIVFGIFAALGVILSAVYILHMVGQILFGPLKTPAAETAPVAKPAKRLSIDLNGRELAILTPLAVLVVLLGVLPNLILGQILQPVQAILRPALVDKNAMTEAAATAKPEMISPVVSAPVLSAPVLSAPVVSAPVLSAAVK
jgi:NADH-quinone oxidoreductase subunit M